MISAYWKDAFLKIKKLKHGTIVVRRGDNARPVHVTRAPASHGSRNESEALFGDFHAAETSDDDDDDVASAW